MVFSWYCKSVDSCVVLFSISLHIFHVCRFKSMLQTNLMIISLPAVHLHVKFSLYLLLAIFCFSWFFRYLCAWVSIDGGAGQRVRESSWVVVIRIVTEQGKHMAFFEVNHDCSIRVPWSFASRQVARKSGGHGPLVPSSPSWLQCVPYICKCIIWELFV